ncbi:MAG: flagellin [Synergistaceae bacterium]|jgi:flagellin|nr:flagellin [Synergistaceae bacterium]
MIVNHNIPAIQAYNALTVTNGSLQKAIQKLSTGLRINTAADDAAGLAISEKMRAQIRGLDRAAANSQDGISMLQTADGALTETHSILDRMRELTVQAANDTLTQEDRQYIQLEIDQLKDEISRIANTTQFNKKKLLDGSAAALWSSDKLETRGLIRGGLQQTDRFGQKFSAEGNFKLSINVTAGQAEIQKSDIFKIKHNNVIMNLNPLDKNSGYEKVEVDSLPAGTYKVYQDISTGTKMAGDWGKVGGSYGLEQGDIDKLMLNFSAAGGTTLLRDNIGNVSIMLEVDGAINSPGSLSVTFRANVRILKTDGTVESYTDDNLVVTTAGVAGANGESNPYKALGFDINIMSAMYLKVAAGGDVAGFNKGDKLVINITPEITDTTGATHNKSLVGIIVSATMNADAPNGWAGSTENRYVLDVEEARDKEIQFRNFYVNSNNGTVYDGSVKVTFNQNLITNTSADFLRVSFEAAYIGQVAKGDVKLRDLDKFWDANGRFLLDDPKKITIYQGSDNSASITIYATDTLEDVREKLNDAVAYGLEQARYVNDARAQFVSFVEDDTTYGSTTVNGNKVNNSTMSVPGTLVIRSLIPGENGKLHFTADEEIINALSLNVIHEAKESSFRISVTDAHDGRNIASNVNVSGNVMYGIVNPNVDVEFDVMADTAVTWNEAAKRFDLIAKSGSYETIFHLADNTTVFQIGAGEGEDMSISMGDMSAHALGVDDIIVTDRESAARGITKIDEAIFMVSSQRAKFGAYQNRLEHNINNLTTASVNTTASESRIRDADMAKEMVEFTKLNILSQAGNSMLAQANQLPQNILSLLR